MTQLNLFDNLSNEAPNPHLRVCSVGGSFVFQNGIKNADFVIFNPLNKELVNEKPLLHEIQLKASDFWSDIKSMVWSSNCRFFFVVNENHIIIGNTHDDEAFLCSNLSMQVFEEFFKAFGGRY
jgi:hypothetical protein